MEMTGGGGDFDKPASRVIAIMQSIVWCGFFDEQPASVIQEVAGFAFAITDGVRGDNGVIRRAVK
ncbi:hypothetical protein SOASR015_31730 [Pectobacterium carotovorum subsp. carotovorum]|nr:hypothetical protein SOASR015_31730 [Pectobacterium carotovorum subsp. carotovorum]GLX58035.1 hypothetical protein Pcaca02_33440 [Pectobacterium carotovorum subsp. carotovorum]